VLTIRSVVTIKLVAIICSARFNNENIPRTDCTYVLIMILTTYTHCFPILYSLTGLSKGSKLHYLVIIIVITSRSLFSMRYEMNVYLTH